MPFAARPPTPKPRDTIRIRAGELAQLREKYDVYYERHLVEHAIQVGDVVSAMVSDRTHVFDVDELIEVGYGDLRVKRGAA